MGSGIAQVAATSGCAVKLFDLNQEALTKSKNALEIAKRAGLLYDKFFSFTQDLEEIGKRIDQTQTAYEQAHQKLMSGRGNLVTSVEKLKTLGARASKQLPDHLLEDDTDELVAGLGSAETSSAEDKVNKND